MKAYRTPDERFENLPDFPFAPHYLDDLPGYEGLRMAYLDEGPADAGEVFLCLHGQPTWSFLYRKMLPVFVESGARVVCPDLFGFGRSDKPVEDEVYTFGFHRQSLVAFIERLDLTHVTLVVQDWGGLIGLTLPMDMPERIDRLLVMNTALAVGRAPGKGFLEWKTFSAKNPEYDIAKLMARAVPGITDEERAAYSAPFPNAEARAGVRRFPELVPISPEMDGVEVSKRAVEWLSSTWDGEAFMVVGELDPVLGPPVMQWLQKVIRGCPPPLMLPHAGHFVQEAGVEVANAALVHFDRTKNG